jgi:dUTP pyrophosphatase
MIYVGAGVIDSDYRGVIKVLLINHGQTEFTVNPGDRIAQLILERAEILRVEEREELPPSQRGESGFGSTGKTAEQLKTSSTTETTDQAYPMPPQSTKQTKDELTKDPTQTVEPTKRSGEEIDKENVKIPAK